MSVSFYYCNSLVIATTYNLQVQPLILVTSVDAINTDYRAGEGYLKVVPSGRSTDSRSVNIFPYAFSSSSLMSFSL